MRKSLIARLIVPAPVLVFSGIVSGAVLIAEFGGHSSGGIVEQNVTCVGKRIAANGPSLRLTATCQTTKGVRTLTSVDASTLASYIHTPSTPLVQCAVHPNDFFECGAR